MDADFLNRRGAELFFQDDLEGARLHYLAALRLDPGFVPSMMNLAAVLSNQGKLDAAEALLWKILLVVPQDANQWNCLGNVLLRLDRFEEAVNALAEATALDPDLSSAWHNLAVLELRRNQPLRALECINEAESLGGGSPRLDNDKAHMLLATGDLTSALQLYEARWESMIRLPPWDFSVREWKGEDLRGKKILCHAEQGFGDTIMTSRFTKNLVDRGARVYLGLPRSLCSLFGQQNWPGVWIVDIEELDPGFMQSLDFHSPMYSAMRWLEITQDKINPEPYLKVPEIVVPRISSPGSLNVGICWASGKRNSDLDWRRRVAPLRLWLPLAGLPNIHLYSLQKDEESEEITNLGAEALITDYSRSFASWADTAAFINQLDLVVSVDTAVAHLAGALGKRVWMLSQFSHCWRWWNIRLGTGFPWYETMEIIRQREPGDWATQLNHVYNRLSLRKEALKCVV